MSPPIQQGNIETLADKTLFDGHLERYKTVTCKIQKVGENIQGTGCLLSNRLLMTCYHVFGNYTKREDDPKDLVRRVADKYEVIFHQMTYRGVTQSRQNHDLKTGIKFDPDFYLAISPNNKERGITRAPDSEHLDYVVIGLKQDSYLDEIAQAAFFSLNLSFELKLSINQPVCILQYPYILDPTTQIPRSLSYAQGKVREITDCSLSYDAATDKGSSGSAVVDIQGRFIALHHQAKNGLNYAVSVKKIIEHLKKQEELDKILNICNRTRIINLKDNYRLEFHTENNDTFVTLLQGEEKLGTRTLKGFSIQSNLTYEALSKEVRKEIDDFLLSHNVYFGHEPLSFLRRLVTSSQTSPVTTSLSFTDRSFPNASLPASTHTKQSRANSSSTIQLSIGEIKKFLDQYEVSEKEIDAISEKAFPDDHQLLLVDALFQKIISLEKITSLDDCLLGLQGSKKYNLLMASIVLKNEEKFDEILPFYSQKKEFYAKDIEGRNALHLAAATGSAHITEALLHKISWNEKDGAGLTPFHWAIREGGVEAAQILLINGASLTDPLTYLGNQYYPIELVVSLGNIDLLNLFLQKDWFKQVDLTRSIPGVGSLLHLAIHANQSPMLGHLLSRHSGALEHILNQRDSQGRTPLQLAAFLGDLNAIRHLNDHKVDLNFGESEAGGTAVHYAALGEQPDAIRLLDWLNAPLTSLDSEQKTPLLLLKGKNSPLAKECEAILTNLTGKNRTERTEPPNFAKRPPFNLVIQGGGSGLACLGAIQKMEELKAFSMLKRVTGISDGAIAAAFIAVGFGAEELRTHLKNNLAELLGTEEELERDLLLASQRGSYRETIQTILKEYWAGQSTVLYPARRVNELKNKLQDLEGIASGERLGNWIENIIHEKTRIPYCTFKELKELTEKDSRKKELYLFSLCVQPGSKNKLERFSHEDPCWKNLIISDAIIASLSIPGLIKPHVVHFKDSSGRYPREDLGKFIDPGLICSFPIDAFDDEKYQEDRFFRGEKTNRRTLGLSFINTAPQQEEIAAFSSSSDLVKALIKTYFNAEQILLEETDRYKDRTIVIPVQNVGLLDSSSSKEVQDRLIASGKAAMESFLKLDSSNISLPMPQPKPTIPSPPPKDHKEAPSSSLPPSFQKILNEAEQGDPIAQYEVFLAYDSGIGVTKNKNKAKEYYKLALTGQNEIHSQADMGNSRAQLIMGRIQSDTRNYSEAIKWYKKAAEAEDEQKEAQYQLGLIYENGLDVEKNYNEAALWFTKAVKNGHDEALTRLRTIAKRGNACGQVNLGILYQDACNIIQNDQKGCNIEQRDAKAVKWFRKSAEQGNADGQYHLGLMYESGRGVLKDDVEAAKWFKKAAEQGHANGQYRLGIMYEKGRGVKDDFYEAAKWLKKTAEQGNLEGYYYLGMMCEKHRRSVAKYSYQAEAKDSYIKAAERGHVGSQCNLGRMYFEDRDHKEALYWYRRASEQGNAEGQYRLGIMCEKGYGVKENYKEAVEWYTKAAEQGHAGSQYNLGRMYLKGRGVDKSDEQASKWFTKAAEQFTKVAEQGDAEGQYTLGLMYQHGYGVNKNDEEAFKWYVKSAEQGNTDGQYYLGLMYENGKGVPKDKDKAEEWFRKATVKGYANASYRLGIIYMNEGKNDREAIYQLERAAQQGKVEGLYYLGIMYENHRPTNASILYWHEALRSYTTAAEKGHVDSQCSLGRMYFEGREIKQNYKEALYWYTKAAEQGNAEGQYHLGIMYENGSGVEKNYDVAVEWYTKATEQGHAGSQSNLGCMYLEGRGVDKSNEQAIKWFTKAAEQGDAKGQYNLGHMYEHGYEVEKSDEEAIKWYVKAAEQKNLQAMKWFQTKAEEGNASSQVHLGKMYQEGRGGLQKNAMQAQAWFRKAAEQEDVEGQFNLALVCEKELGWQNEALKWYVEAAKQGLSKAKTWVQKSAEQGNSKAQFNLGLMYEQGLGIEQNDAKAMKWYKKAAEQGNGEGQFNLAVMYEKGCEGFETEQSNAEAMKWYKQAAEQGKVEWQCNLGIKYRDGLLTEQNYAEAIKWLTKAVEKSNAQALECLIQMAEDQTAGGAKAQLSLGILYENGRGVSLSVTDASNWYKKAAEQGLAEGQYRLGLMYEKGHGIEQSDTHAVEWYTKAAEQGLAEGQYHLGCMYENGCGIKKNKILALEWYTKAAEQGNAEWQDNLGIIYRDGRCIKQSDEEAIKWFAKAAEQGNSEGQVNLGIMYRDGRSVKLSDEDAIKWFTKAAEQESARGQWNLGNIYREKRNYDEAFKWYTKAAEQGNAGGQVNLGLMYLYRLVPFSASRSRHNTWYDDGLDDKEAMKWFTKAAEQGDAGGQYMLGYMHEQQRGVSIIGHIGGALEWYTKAAEQGHAMAQVHLGHMYEKGRGVSKNDTIAFDWYKKAACQGNAVGQVRLGFMYAEGRGISKNDILAVEFYTKAALQGNTEGQYLLGFMYERGRGVRKNKNKAEEWYTKVIKQKSKPQDSSDNPWVPLAQKALEDLKTCSVQ
jgi:TPR repeat protein/predicted acylesterase/phospholipase RssA/ankyrin repeat protein